MIELAAQQEYERAAALRQGTWQLLEEYTRRRSDDQDTNIIDGLQDAANRLGAVEQLLLEKSGDTRYAERSLGVAAPSPKPDDAPRIEPDHPINAEAAIVLALAEIFVPLAASAADEAERWLHIMREHGTVGAALQELGMASGQLSTPSLPARRRDVGDLNPVTVVASEASKFASGRGARAIATVDVLFAVIRRYGPVFDRALYGATSKHRTDLLATLVTAREWQPSAGSV